MRKSLKASHVIEQHELLPVLERLMSSDEASVRYKTLTWLLDEEPSENAVEQEKVRTARSQRVKTLLSERNSLGEIPVHPYKKWYGAHWVLAMLAELEYPAGDDSLIPLREQVYRWLFSSSHERSIVKVEGKVRRCASQEGYALFYLLKLGLDDHLTDELARRLIQWQWPDGGWNCDKRREAGNSSFMESLIPMRGLALYASVRGESLSRDAALKASELFLKRRLFRKQSDGTIIHSDFLKLHYPCYWHYDILFALIVLLEAGLLKDERCADALDLLVSKWLSTGGFPAEKKYYSITDKKKSGRSLVDWGKISKSMNEFVTVEALHVLKEAERIK